jgi:invasion protein IalB
MTRTPSVFGLGFAFVLGCVAAPLAQQYVARPASAAPESARRWEQYCTSQRGGMVSNFTDVNDKVNEDLKQRGLEGFELVSVSNDRGGSQLGFVYCFKRPLP